MRAYVNANAASHRMAKSRNCHKLMRLAFEWHAVKVDINIKRTHTHGIVCCPSDKIYQFCSKSFGEIEKEHHSVRNFQWAATHCRKTNANVENAKRTFSATNAVLWFICLILCILWDTQMQSADDNVHWHCSVFALWLIATGKQHSTAKYESSFTVNDWKHAIEVSAASEKVYFVRKLICRNHCNRFVFPSIRCSKCSIFPKKKGVLHLSSGFWWRIVATKIDWNGP